MNAGTEFDLQHSMFFVIYVLHKVIVFILCIESFLAFWIAMVREVLQYLPTTGLYHTHMPTTMLQATPGGR